LYQAACAAQSPGCVCAREQYLRSNMVATTGPGSNGYEEPENEKEVTIQVPAGATPGVTKLGVRLSEKAERLVATVPKQALPGDHIVFAQDDAGSWSMKLVPVAPRAGKLEELGTQAPAPAPAVPSVAKNTITATAVPQFNKSDGRIVAFVPYGVKPGESAIAIDLPASATVEAGAAETEQLEGTRTVGIAVPPTAQPGDMVLIKDGPDGLEVAVQKERLQVSDRTSLAERFKSVSGRISHAMEDGTACERLFAALKKADVFVTPKCARAAVPPLCIPGLAATEHISQGEEIMRIPRRVHLSTQTPLEACPELCKEVDACEKLGDGLKEKSKLAIFLADLLRRAEERANGLEPSAPLPGCEGVAEDVFAVWEAYADGLLGVDFDTHPQLHGACNPEVISEELEPSPQADIVLDMASEVQSSHEALLTSCSSRVLGPGFEDMRHWVRARLCILSRVFEAYTSYTLVPVVDLMNHSVNPGVAWRWSAEDDAMIATTTRAHQPGEELFDSYGERSSELLYQTYGFTVPPELEQAWSYELRSERAHSIYEHFLPKSKALHFILMETERIDETLTVALDAVKSHGQNPEDFLLLACSRVMAAIGSDPKLQAPLLALKKVRSLSPSRSDWWTQLADEDKSCLDEDSTRIKMGEFLCLVAHIEAVLVFRRMMLPQNCFARTAHLRQLLASAFIALRTSGSCTTIST